MEYPKRFIEIVYSRHNASYKCYKTNLFDITDVAEPMLRIFDIVRNYVDSYLDGSISVISFKVFYEDDPKLS